MFGEKEIQDTAGTRLDDNDTMLIHNEADVEFRSIRKR